MRGLLAALALVAGIASAQAQTWVTWVQGGGAGQGSTNYVPTNAALAAASTISYPNGVWRNDYASGNGAPPLFFQPSASPCSLNAGAGDNGSQVQSSNGGCWLAVFPGTGADIREWGAATGATGSVNATAVTAALAYAASQPNGGAILVPGGTFPLASQITLSVTGSNQVVTLEGAANATSSLSWPSAGGGIAITLANGTNAFNVANLSLLVGVTNGGTALSITSNASSFDTVNISNINNVTIKGADGGMATDYWTTGVNLFQVSYLNSFGLSIFGSNATGGQGNGVLLAASSGTPSFVFNFTSANFQNLAVDIQPGNWIQGINVSQSNLSGGIGVNIPGSLTGNFQLSLINNQCNVTSECVLSNSLFPDIFFHGNLVLATGGGGVILPSNARVSIIGNHLEQQGAATGTAISIGTTSFSLGGVIADNFISGFSVGVSLASGSVGYRVQDNVNGGGNTTFISNASSSNIIPGQVISATVPIGSAVSLATGTSKDVTSVSLTPGNWLVFGSVSFNPAGTTTITSIGSSISTTSDTGGVGSFFPSSSTGVSSSLSAGPSYLTLGVTTTVYLEAIAGFGTSTMSAYGTISAIQQP